MMYVPACLLEVCLAFYDIQRGHGYTERSARLQAELYMRRKDPDVTPLDAALALADGLAKRAAARLSAAEAAITEPPNSILYLTASG